MRHEIMIDGNRFDDMMGFYDEIERVLTKGLPWKIGRNLTALNDVLRGGFGIHEYGERLVIKWINFEKSKADLGYPATAAYYEQILARSHPSDIPLTQAKIHDAKNQKGQTLLDIIVEIILNTDNSGHDCILERGGV